MGEISLDGSLQAIKGALPMAIQARREGFKGFILPKENAREAAIVNDLEVCWRNKRQEVATFFNGKISLQPEIVNTREEFYKSLDQVTKTTSAMYADWKILNARWRSLQRAGTMLSSSVRQPQAIPCWREDCRPYCRWH